jgi:hypothetical protein
MGCTSGASFYNSEFTFSNFFEAIDGSYEAYFISNIDLSHLIVYTIKFFFQTAFTTKY